MRIVYINSSISEATMWKQSYLELECLAGSLWIVYLQANEI